MWNLKAAVEISSLSLLLTLESFFPFFPNSRNRKAHGLRNLGVGIAGFLAVSILFSSLLAGSLEWAEANGFGLLNWISLRGAWEAVAALVLFDLWMYVWHRANHRIPFLWRFHRMHHSDGEMDATTALRFHPGEILLSSAARLCVAPLLGIGMEQVILYETLLQPVILFHHSNVALPEKWDRVLRAVIVSPNMHRVHHSREPGETNSNYSSVFSIWDRILRSFRLRGDARTIRYGLREFPENPWQSFWGMMRTPLADPARADDGGAPKP